jgi:hypothetical protein
MATARQLAKNRNLVAECAVLAEKRLQATAAQKGRQNARNPRKFATDAGYKSTRNMMTAPASSSRTYG